MIGMDLDDRELRAKLEQLLSELRGTPKTWATVSRVIEQLVRNTFRDETDPWGTPWPPHSPTTLENRVRQGQYSLQRLIDSGALYSSITRDSDASSATLSVGEGLEYAEVQQFGNPKNRAWGGPIAPIPARSFLPIHSRADKTPDMTAEWLAAVLEPFDNALQEVVK